MRLLLLLLRFLRARYVLAKPCSWFQGIVTWSAFVRWTTWNSCFLLYWIEACSWQPVEPGSRWCEWMHPPYRSALGTSWQPCRSLTLAESKSLLAVCTALTIRSHIHGMHAPLGVVQTWTGERLAM